MRTDDNFFMELAIREAWKYQILTYPNPSVGAVVAKDGRVLAVEAHKKAGDSHAEVRAMVRAYETITDREVDFDLSNALSSHNFLLSLPEGFFSDTTIYITLEPCSHVGKTPSCAELLSKLKPKKVVVATIDPVSEHSGGVTTLKRVGVDVKVGVLKRRAESLIEPFIIWRKRAFLLFKLAQGLNGRIGGGYISSKSSLTHTHKIREVVDRLVIGGNTVRVDRPTLDCRFSSRVEAPDVLIYSHQKDFDRTIPLFKVQNREVKIGSHLELFKPSLILIEGGEGMLKALLDKIDWLLVYVAPKLSSNNVSYNVDRDIEFLHQEKMDIDYILWSRLE